MVPLGMQEAACAIIGNEIGAGNVSLAKKYYKVVSTIAGTALLVISLACFFGRQGITDLFTNVPAVNALTVTVMPILAVQYLFDGLQGYCQGPIRALGL